MQKVSFSSCPKTRVGNLRSMGTSRDIPGSVRKREIMFMVVLNPKERGERVTPCLMQSVNMKISKRMAKLWCK